MNYQIHFVTGKGGVGKSVVAAAMALKKSREGHRVLLVELGDQSFYKDFFELPEVEFEPTPLRENVSVALWSGAECLREYAFHLIRVERLAKLFFENQVMKTFLNIAPALSELAILGKITSGPRKHGPALPYDCIIVDAYATGHFSALLEAPEGMSQVVQFGPMGEQSRAILKCIKDSSLCHYHIVTLPEELPVREAIELRQKLEDDFQVKADCYLNKELQVNNDASELDSLAKEDSDFGEFASYVLFHKNNQTQMRLELEKSFESVQSVPLVFNSQPWEILEKVVEVIR